MKRYKYTKLLKLGPVDGFIIYAPDDMELRDTHPQTIVRELNRMADRIKRLKEACRDMASEDTYNERDKEWFQVIESILGFHPVSITEALKIGISCIKNKNDRIKQLEEENDAMRADLLLWQEQEVKL